MRLRRARLLRCGPQRARDREVLKFCRCPRQGFPMEAREGRRDQSPGPPEGKAVQAPARIAREGTPRSVCTGSTSAICPLA